MNLGNWRLVSHSPFPNLGGHHDFNFDFDSYLHFVK